MDGVPLPTEYVRKLVKSGKINPGELSAETLATTPSSTTVSSSSNPEGPYAKCDKLYLWIFEAKDSAHKPTQEYLSDTLDAYARFYQFNPGTLYYYHVRDWWDASDVSPKDSAVKLLEDLAQDEGWVRDAFNDGDPANDIVMGWVDYIMVWHT